MRVLALDIGGANIKLALGAMDDGDAVSKVQAMSLPFALWKEPGRLTERLREAAHGLRYDALAVTMTGELCDCFEGRREGVHHLLDAVRNFAAGTPVRVWLTEGRFVTIDEAMEKWLACASANWHAQAAWVASLFPLGASLLMDTGSTTTDIVLLRDGSVDAPGRTDQARMHAGLVYTGAGRTPLMALSPVTLPSQMPDEPPLHLIAELFATTADVYVLTGDQPEEPFNRDTADGRPLTRAAAAARVLRMIGADFQVYESALAGQTQALALAGLNAADMPMRAAMDVAQACAAVQRGRIVAGIRQVMAGPGAAGDCVCIERVIVTGSGDFVAARAAAAAFEDVPVLRLADRIGRDASIAACPVALLHLWGLSPSARQ